MKNIKYFLLAILFLTGLFTSCGDYLDNVPKGQKIPTTLEDFSSLIADEYNNQREPVTQAIILLNDRYVTTAYQNYYPLWKANYNWDTTIDRVAENKADESTYYVAYAAISNANLILENVAGATGATEEQKKIVAAQAKILRAHNYFVLVNYYSKTYNATTAATDGGVPLITNSEVGASYTQPSVQAIYEFILNDIAEAIPDLPETSQNVLYANKATGYALAARVYLQMSNYAEALTNANQALSRNDRLYDWNKFYTTYQSLIENLTSYQTIVSPMSFDYVENYSFRHGESSYAGNDNAIPVARAEEFEKGDASFLGRWKLRTVGSDTYYDKISTGFINKGGLTTTEIYLIKAEAEARAGNISEAMIVLNTVRKARILNSVYADLTATTQVEAIKQIAKVKRNALIQTIVPFCDTRRLNLEAAYARILSKTVNNATVTLTPDSYMWTMPFPQGAVSNPGNGTIKQNVER